MSKPIAVLVGFIGKWPLAGMALSVLHYIAGLHDLGYAVHYVERQNGPGECYDPRGWQMTDDPTVALACLDTLLPQFGVTSDAYSFIDLEDRCYGSGWARLREVLSRADFVINLGDPTWFDELDLCPRRAFVDIDPMFTQLEMIRGEGVKRTAVAHYDTLFSYGTRIGQADCTVPEAGRSWLPAGPVVATRVWRADTAGSCLPITTVMNWSAGPPLRYRGRRYGYKDRTFKQLEKLPGRSGRSFVIAMGGPAPFERLERSGWTLVSALAVTETISIYQDFIAGSSAELGIAKHAYVASRSGWFSDRSTCYLAAGRPVLHQDTGFADWLPTGEGLLRFGTLGEALERLNELESDYARHSRRARSLARECFEASTALRQMLSRANWE